MYLGGAAHRNIQEPKFADDLWLVVLTIPIVYIIKEIKKNINSQDGNSLIIIRMLIDI